MQLPKIALGAWAWGNDGTFGQNWTKEDLQPIFDLAMAKGLNLWDTAYVYGMGTSEQTLGSFLTGLPRDSYIISDKLTPQVADYSSKTPVADMLETEYQNLGIDHMDIYWVHNPVDAPKWITEVAKYFEGQDQVPMIGVSNHNLAQIKEAEEILRAHGLKLGAVQNHYSLLNRSSEDAGILDYCQENDIVFFSYMVLEQGALSGKYDTEHPMPAGSARAQTYNPVLNKLAIMDQKLTDLAEKYEVSPAQIPVAWAIAKGTLPIIGVTKASHVLGALKAEEVELTAEEISDLEETADSLDLNLVRMWEQKMD
ncbi:MAG: aldo/keto reductase [Limosilactobacillus mucosae]